MVADSMGINKNSQEVINNERGNQNTIFKDEQRRLRRNSKEARGKRCLKCQGRNDLFSFNYQDPCVTISLFQGKEK